MIFNDKEILQNKIAGFPAYIELQTQNLCNADCIICPYCELKKKFEYTKLDFAVIEKVISECDKHCKDVKRIIPYLNNEPSLDKRLIDVLRRIKVKNHFVELSSNLSSFTEAEMCKIVREKLVDEFRISIFGGNAEDYHLLMPNLNFEDTIQKMYDLLNLSKENPQMEIKIVMILAPFIDAEKNLSELKRIFPDVNIETFGFLDRAGSVKRSRNNLRREENEIIVPRGCILNRPYERMCILSTGQVILCSQDWERKHNIGNIYTESISEIWNGINFDKERNIICGGEDGIRNSICVDCKLLLMEQDKQLCLNFTGDRYVNEIDEVII